MASLTSTQIQTLQGILNSGDIAAFYGTLESYGDSYADLGKGVTNNDTWQGQLANSFAASSAANVGLDMTYGSPLWENVNTELAQQYIDAYSLNGGNTPTWQSVQSIHNQVFGDAGIPNDGWFPNKLLNESEAPSLTWTDYLENTGAADLYGDALDVAQAGAGLLFGPYMLYEWYNSSGGPDMGDMEFAKNFFQALIDMTPAMRDAMLLDLNPLSALVDLLNNYASQALLDLMMDRLNDLLGGAFFPLSAASLALPEPTPDKQASPLILDLDGDGVELHAIGNYDTYFDLKATGQAVLTGWVAPDDGLLAIDLNNDGVINNGSELFGTETTDGFTMLKSYDLNLDGVINSSDAVFTDLKVWTDVNSDGYSQNDELFTLTELGITKLGLDTLRVSENLMGNTITHEASFTINGVEQTLVDAWFAYNPTMTSNTEAYTFDTRMIFLPTIGGYGDLKAMHIAASIDNGAGVETLMSQLLNFIDGRTLSNSLSDWGATKTAVENILLRWAGVEDIDPNSRGAYVDAQQLAFYEAFRGYEFDQYGSSNPLAEAGKFVEAVFDYLVTWEAMQLVVQNSGAEIFTDLSYNIYTGKIVGDLALLQTGIDALEDAATLSSNGADVWAHFAQFIGYTKGLENLTTAELTALDAAVLATGDPSVSDWQDVVSHMTASLGSIIDSSDDWASFEINYDNLISGTSGDDTITDGNAGGLTNNEFRGLNGNDIIYGLTGHDKLLGGAGNDTLVGGLGDDFLLGGTGDDTYVYESGNDTISEKSGDGTDTLLIAASTGLTEANLTDLYRYENNLLVLLSNGDVITIDGYSQTGQDIETITFESNSYSINLAALITQKFYGSSHGDRLTVSGEAFQTLLTYGYGGNDTITADGGSALFYGGDGYDTLIGDYLNDTLHGDNQDDALFGLGGNDTLDGGNGNDTLDGGTGNDLLDGGAGDNTFIFNLGYETDTIAKETTSVNTKILFGTGITTSNIILDRSPISGELDDITFISTSGDKLIVDEMYSRNSYFFYLIEKFQFADGTVWNSTNVHDAYISQHTTSGNDVVYGFEMADTFQSSAGDDYIAGYSGADTYYWGIGSGNDTIFDQLRNTNNGSGADQIIFTGGLIPSDLVFSQSGDNLIIQSLSTADSITIPQYFALSYYRIEDFVFSNGTTLHYSDIITLVNGSALVIGTENGETLEGNTGSNQIEGRGGDDIIIADSGDDTLSGGLGNDDLQGEDGNDSLNGNEGNDTLKGAKGNDTYIHSSGNDIITEAYGTGSGTDTILFGAGITLSNLIIHKVDDDLVIDVSDGSTITVVDHFDVNTRYLESLTFADSSHFYLNSTNQVSILGTSGNDVLDGDSRNASINDLIYGYAGNDNLRGKTGDDLIYGGDGQDTLTGDAGVDSLYGEAGNDTVNGNDGNDLMYGGLGVDTMSGGNNDDTVYGENGSDILNGDAGNDYLDGGADNDTLDGGDGNDVLAGGDGNDIIYGQAGNDNISGGAGDDIIYELRSGTDVISGGDGIDTLDYSGSSYAININLQTGVQSDSYSTPSSDTISGIENVIGSSGYDTITGDSYANILQGKSGNDTLYGDGGNDSIYGGAGLDSMYGGLGADTFIFETASAFSNIDKIKDFSTAQGDKIDIKELLVGYDPLTSAITDFLQITTSGANSVVKVDRDGSGSTYSLSQIATIEGVTGLTDEQALLTNGHLVVA